MMSSVDTDELAFIAKSRGHVRQKSRHRRRRVAPTKQRRNVLKKALDVVVRLFQHQTDASERSRKSLGRR